MNNVVDFFHKRTSAIQNFQPFCFRFIIQSFANAMGTDQEGTFCQSIQIFYDFQSFRCQVVCYGFIMNELSIGIQLWFHANGFISHFNGAFYPETKACGFCHTNIAHTSTLISLTFSMTFSVISSIISVVTF